jgi:DNA-binding transcriptional LysR family regulator
MELRHLRYFVAIGEEENYRRAALLLHVAQTALSTQIQDLEAELGFRPFDRLPRGVKLSAAAKLFLEDARRILREVNEAAARLSRGARSIGDFAWRLHGKHGAASSRIRSDGSANASLTPSCS